MTREEIHNECRDMVQKTNQLVGTIKSEIENELKSHNLTELELVIKDEDGEISFSDNVIVQANYRDGEYYEAIVESVYLTQMGKVGVNAIDDLGNTYETCELELSWGEWADIYDFVYDKLHNEEKENN